MAKKTFHLSRTEGVYQMPGSISDIQGDIFYIEARAPYVMERGHVHGHVELNFLINCSATYIINGRREEVPENRLAIFWANVPHQMIDIQGEGKLFNLYIPLPLFLEWSLPEQFRQDILSGNLALARLDASLLYATLDRWFREYSLEQTEFRELILGEIALCLKRVALMGWDHPDGIEAEAQVATSKLKGAQHVSEMVRFIAENLHKPISTADVAKHLGLHKNYTTNLFSSVMGNTIKQYLQFQRLQKAQLMLQDKESQISEVGLSCGFSSNSRFYEAFQKFYGMPPGQFRKQILKAA
ncbi:AraC family transcriptional regulator [Endozoicomonas sp. OPT23]|uniref:helix-turn-helix domain-containing protein n=1 Tax=Endozoicomonas sp. OPT23 TaxID=2072845 RepID=UPI00129A17BE|nr:helix-turn-helix domain-containing protein [Endozoicomonas sp. OPT23]MRI32625.1 AraC family transcriptional regulator [Endozoicomonas sp. OPT23]